MGRQPVHLVLISNMSDGFLRQYKHSNWELRRAMKRLREDWMKLFVPPPPTDTLYYFGQQEDLERADRYEKIWSILADYSYAKPKVPEINDILPLPPAKLPPWDGKLKWLEERKANVPPPKPSEALIEQLAKEKHLDPATGRPLPGSPHFVRLYPTQICYSGDVCPHSGYWQVASSWAMGKAARYVEQGETLPRQLVERFHPRPWPFADTITQGEEAAGWRLLGEA